MVNIFSNIDFSSLKNNIDFKEDSVREVIILPLLKTLYLLKIENNYAWVLDAKAPNENIKDGEHIEQVYNYASHPEVNRIAPNYTDLDLITYFELRLKKVIAAKKEMEYYINKNTISNAQIVKNSATDLSFIANESIDYIYTDPPYGKKIPSRKKKKHSLILITW
jgi:hypothetical protein